MSSIASLESAMLTNTEKATLLRELADEFGYKLYSKTPTYILNRPPRRLSSHRG
jgi:hypothetical protein